MTAIDQHSSAAGFGTRAAGRAAADQSRLALPVKIYLLAVVIPIAFTIGPLYMTGLRLVLLLCFLPALVKLLRGDAGPLLPTDILFGLHMAWALLCLSINNPDIFIENGGSLMLEFLGGYMIGRVYIRDRLQFIKLCKWLSFVAAIMLPFALYETQTGRPILIEMIHRVPGIFSEGIITIEGRLGMERVQGVFAHPIHFGLFCSVAFSLTFVALKGIFGTFRRYITSIVIAICCFSALSSGAILALAGQFFLICWYVVFRNVNGRWWILFGLFVVVYVAIDLLSTRTPIQVFMSYATFSAHNAYWRMIILEWGIKNVIGDATHGVPAAPWFGIGLNDWIRPDFMHSGSMDNFWLVNAIRFGLPGLVLLAAGYLYMLFRIGLRDMGNDIELQRLRRAWMFTFAGLTFTLSTVHVWTTIFSFVFFVFGAGVWMLTAALKGEDGAAETASQPETPPERGPRYTRYPARPSVSAGAGRPAVAQRGAQRGAQKGARRGARSLSRGRGLT